MLSCCARRALLPFRGAPRTSRFAGCFPRGSYRHSFPDVLCRQIWELIPDISTDPVFQRCIPRSARYPLATASALHSPQRSLPNRARSATQSRLPSYPGSYTHIQTRSNGSSHQVAVSQPCTLNHLHAENHLAVHLTRRASIPDIQNRIFEVSGCFLRMLVPAHGRSARPNATPKAQRYCAVLYCVFYS